LISFCDPVLILPPSLIYPYAGINFILVPLEGHACFALFIKHNKPLLSHQSQA